MTDEKLKYRHELKYLVTDAQCAILKNRIRPLMRQDLHAGVSGQYSVRSLYFDDYDDRCYYENLDGVDPREKYRIRIYDLSDRCIKLECKRKERGTTRKKTSQIPIDLAHSLIDCSNWDNQMYRIDELSSVAKSLVIKRLQPKIIVEYTRIPFEYSVGNVRITFDMGISFSSSISGFFEESIPRRPVMPGGLHILEVKYDELVPDHIYRALNLDTLQRTTLSKYYICRKLSM
jgi:SPX domain protein involved in polyphosphate accumulation